MLHFLLHLRRALLQRSLDVLCRCVTLALLPLRRSTTARNVCRLFSIKRQLLILRLQWKRLRREISLRFLAALSQQKQARSHSAQPHGACLQSRSRQCRPSTLVLKMKMNGTVSATSICSSTKTCAIACVVVQSFGILFVRFFSRATTPKCIHLFSKQRRVVRRRVRSLRIITRLISMCTFVFRTSSGTKRLLQEAFRRCSKSGKYSVMKECRMSTRKN